MAARTTVDRLDKPSAYFNSRVYTPPLTPSVTRYPNAALTHPSYRRGRAVITSETDAMRTTTWADSPSSQKRTRSRTPPPSTSATCTSPQPLSPPRPLLTLTCLHRSFYTTEEQVYELFTKCGEIKRLIMGLDRFNKTPCGFCFVEYYTHQDALDCMKYIGGTKLDERIIRTDLDPGFEEGRQYGRGKSGGQVRDEYREDFDEGRGGLGRAIQSEQRLKEVERRDLESDFGRLR